MKTTNSEGCINNEQQNSLPHILPFSINTTVSRLLGCKEIQPVHSEGDQPRDFFGRNDAKAETPAHTLLSH